MALQKNRLLKSMQFYKFMERVTGVGYQSQKNRNWLLSHTQTGSLERSSVVLYRLR